MITRPFVQFEIGVAVSEGIPVLLVHEADDRHHSKRFPVHT